MHPYDYVKKEPHFSLWLQETAPHWLCYKATFPSAHPNRYQENNTAHGEYFMPCTGKCFPFVILLHGLGDRSLVPCRMLARDLAKRGIASFVLHLAVQSHRTSETAKGQPSIPTIDNWLELFQVLVINTCQLVDWAEGRKELDSQAIAVIGISIGGIASAIAMGVDKRIIAGTFIVTGGNMEEITWRGRSDAALTGHSCTQEQCHNVYRHYPRYLAEVAEKGVENVIPAKECFLFDPITFSSYLRGRPILMINAERDDFIPKKSTLEFWEACGKPHIIWLPSNHTTIYRQYRLISREIIAFISSTFDH